MSGHLTFVAVTNIPSPYRLHEFGMLHQELAARGVEFEAVFLATTERGRNWIFDGGHCNFPYQIADGWEFYLKGKPFLVNPGTLWMQWRRPPTWLWLGGSWYLPTIVSLSWLMRWRGKTWVLGWNESISQSHHVISNASGQAIRRLLLRPYHGWIVPGGRAEIYTRQAFADTQPVLTFANTVDETLYRDRVTELRREREALRASLELSPRDVVCLWPARLSPEKGILPFLEAIEPLQGGYTILIAGEGPQRREIEVWLVAHPSMPVRLLGHQDVDHLLKLYALADLLLLPSLSEPFGLVAVEALWARLPLLLSDRVGAVPEVLLPGSNGWSVDPDQPAQIRQVFSEILARGVGQLSAMGQASLVLAEARLTSRPAISHFVDDLLRLFPPRV